LISPANDINSKIAANIWSLTITSFAYCAAIGPLLQWSLGWYGRWLAMSFRRRQHRPRLNLTDLGSRVCVGETSDLVLYALLGVARSHFRLQLLKAGLERFGLESVVIEDPLNQDRVHQPEKGKLPRT
jgi:hypothetical protein